MATTRLKKIRAELDRRRKKELRARKRAFLVGFLILLFLFGKLLYETFAPKPYIPPTPYVVKVVDADNEGISMVRLLFFRPNPLTDPFQFEAKTDAQGRYRLPKKHWNGDWICQARTENGLLSQGFVGDLEPANGFVEMKVLQRIPGRVEDKKGHPLAHARIEVRHRMSLGPPLEEVVSNEKGAFEFSHLSSSLKLLSFKVRKQGYQIKDIEIDFHSEEPLVLKIGPARPIILDVLLPDGSPAVGLQVSIPGYPFVPRLTDDAGRVLFEGLVPSQSYLPRIETPTFTYLLPRTLRPSRHPLMVKLEEPLALEAIAMDRDGNALTSLVITHYHGPWERKECRTDFRGHFRLEGLPSGKARLHYLTPGGEPAEYEIIMRKNMQKLTLKLW